MELTVVSESNKFFFFFLLTVKTPCLLSSFLPSFLTNKLCISWSVLAIKGKVTV